MIITKSNDASCTRRPYNPWSMTRTVNTRAGQRLRLLLQLWWKRRQTAAAAAVEVIVREWETCCGGVGRGCGGSDGRLGGCSQSVVMTTLTPDPGGGGPPAGLGIRTAVQ
jgi:hypothetical protein